MSDYELGNQQSSKTLLARQAEPESNASVDRAVAADAVDRVSCRLGDSSCAAAHAETLNRAVHGDTASTQNSLLRLQRQYGNRYVGDVLGRSATGEAGGDMEAVERSIDQARGGGEGMDHATRSHMEKGFGADFGAVRIHTDSHADALSHTLSARAFATGQDVFFRHGEYNPGTSSGRELLAHELTHVVQQTGGLQRKMTVSQPSDPHEIEAEHMARAFITWESASAQVPHSQSIGREEEEKKIHPRLDDAGVRQQPEAPKDDEEKKHKG
jgi:hypothetical protein